MNPSESTKRFFQPGPTGRFPEGRLNENDEGELTVAFREENGKLIMNFGKDISWLALTPSQAKQIGVILLDKAEALASKNLKIMEGPPTLPFEIKELYAFLSKDEHGEGLCGMPTPDGKGLIAMVAADLKRVVMIKPLAKVLAQKSGLKIILAQFSNRTDLETM